MSRPAFKTDPKSGLLIPIVYTDQHNDYQVDIKECTFKGDMVHVIFAVEDNEFEVNMTKSEFLDPDMVNQIRKKVARLAT